MKINTCLLCVGFNFEFLNLVKRNLLVYALDVTNVGVTKF